MKPQKQLIDHAPAEGRYGDCYRTAIAVVLDLEAKDVPHFMDGTTGKGPAPEANRAVEAWLNERGLHAINILFPAELSPEQIAQTVKNCNGETPGLVFLLSGTSRTGVNHVVVCADGEIACDPSKVDAGIVGPCDDGYYWITFFGSTAALHRIREPLEEYRQRLLILIGTGSVNYPKAMKANEFYLEEIGAAYEGGARR